LEFGGFDAPRYTQVPDALFDELLPYLSEAELKVLLYIIRRTFGFKKEADAISLAQMVHGIVTRDGRRLDWGAGCSESSIKRGIRGLLEKRLILRALRRSPERGDEAPVYRLRLRSDPRGSESTPGGGQIGLRAGVTANLRRGPESTPQETGAQDTESKNIDSNQLRPAKKAHAPRPSPDHSGLQGSVTPAPDPQPLASAPTAARRYAGLHSAYIARVIQDHSTELDDALHWAANVTQAHRVWQASGLGEEAFVAQLHTARQRVRTYQGKQGSGTIAHKMAYYFRVLADLVGVPTELGVGH